MIPVKILKPVVKWHSNRRQVGDVLKHINKVIYLTFKTCFNSVGGISIALACWYEVALTIPGVKPQILKTLNLIQNVFFSVLSTRKEKKAEKQTSIQNFCKHGSMLATHCFVGTAILLYWTVNYRDRFETLILSNSFLLNLNVYGNTHITVKLTTIYNVRRSSGSYIRFCFQNIALRNCCECADCLTKQWRHDLKVYGKVPLVILLYKPIWRHCRRWKCKTTTN